jgi:hypothetical protein
MQSLTQLIFLYNNATSLQLRNWPYPVWTNTLVESLLLIFRLFYDAVGRRTAVAQSDGRSDATVTWHSMVNMTPPVSSAFCATL